MREVEQNIATSFEVAQPCSGTDFALFDHGTQSGRTVVQKFNDFSGNVQIYSISGYPYSSKIYEVRRKGNIVVKACYPSGAVNTQAGGGNDPAGLMLEPRRQRS